MSIYEQFIPGQWIDNIDVNDFVNLNKKPFFEKPIFLTKSTDRANKFSNLIKNLVENDVFSFESLFIDKRNEIIPGIISEDIDIYNNIDFNLYKSNDELYEEISTSEMKKAIRLNLLSGVPSDSLYNFIIPDFRIVALYGTKFLIKEKKNYLKSLEKHFQNQEWIHRRIQLHKEIESIKKLDRLAKIYKFNITEPSTNSFEVIKSIYFTILSTKYENPSIYFTLTQIIPFIDIFIQNDLDKNLITEEEAQEMIDFLILKLNLINNSKNDNLNYLLSETISSSLITKTTYRFLNSLEKFMFTPFSLKIIWNKNISSNFKEFCKNINNENIYFSFLNENFLIQKNNIVLGPNNIYGLIGEDYVFESGSVDLEKVIFLSLNAGKDPITGLTLLPITNLLKDDELNYSNVFSNFKDYLSYVINLYIEHSNLALSISELNQTNFLKNSLMNNVSSYKINFSFINFKKVIEILYALSKNEFSVKRNKTGHITEFIYSKTEIKNYEVVLAHLISFIEKETSKIPLYKNGKPIFKIFKNSEGHIEGKLNSHNFNLNSELSNALFNVNFISNDNSKMIDIVDNWFYNDYSEIIILKKKQKS